MVPSTQTYTPTWTPLPSDEPMASATPTETPIPPPTETPQPPRLHQINAGETLIGLSLRYRVSVESIASANDFGPDAPIRVGESLLIPWPTATPPLVPVAVTVRGINVVADPTDCDRYEVRGGDSLLKIAAQHDVDIELLMLVNRMSEETLLLPGDSLCIPEIVIGATMPATPGPTPTTTPTLPPTGPQLLYPVRNAVVDQPEGIVALQWVAVKDLDESEWYMVEVTDIDQLDSLPHRDFTRDTSFQLPQSWRPTEDESHLFRWRISVVQVTGERSDGAKTYRYGGESSNDGLFTWQGAVPTVPPTPYDTPKKLSVANRCLV
jgi:LysM repeat protein